MSHHVRKMWYPTWFLWCYSILFRSVWGICKGILLPRLKPSSVLEAVATNAYVPDVQGNNSSSSPLRSDGSWIWWKQLLQQLPTDVQTSIFTSETQPCVRGCFAPKAYSVNRTMFIIQERMVYITMVIFSPLWFLLWN